MPRATDPHPNRLCSMSERYAYRKRTACRDRGIAAPRIAQPPELIQPSEAPLDHPAPSTARRVLRTRVADACAEARARGCRPAPQSGAQQQRPTLVLSVCGTTGEAVSCRCLRGILGRDSRIA